MYLNVGKILSHAIYDYCQMKEEEHRHLREMRARRAETKELIKNAQTIKPSSTTLTSIMPPPVKKKPTTDIQKSMLSPSESEALINIDDQ